VILTYADLARFLGGSDDSFTGLLLMLIAKSDSGNMRKLAEAFPYETAAWRIWHEADPALTAAELRARVG
jgi:hypothetical protein